MYAYRDFCAHQFYVKDCFLAGTITLRWRVLRKDIQDKFLVMADEQIKKWFDEEENSRASRENRV